MARRSLKPQLNQIRAWVRQGRTDAWIAHQLEVSASELRQFRKQHDLTADGEDASADVDLRDEIEAEIEAATAEEEAEEEEPEEEDEQEEPGEEDEDDGGREEKKPKPARKGGKSKEGDDEAEGDGGSRPKRRRRRGRRGGRGRRKEIEATFDHGERDGYGLWLDASVKDNPVYAEHWAGKNEVTVRIEADQIVIRRAGDSGSGDSDD